MIAKALANQAQAQPAAASPSSSGTAPPGTQPASDPGGPSPQSAGLGTQQIQQIQSVPLRPGHSVFPQGIASPVPHTFLQPVQQLQQQQQLRMPSPGTLAGVTTHPLTTGGAAQQVGGELSIPAHSGLLRDANGVILTQHHVGGAKRDAPYDQPGQEPANGTLLTNPHGHEVREYKTLSGTQIIFNWTVLEAEGKVVGTPEERDRAKKGGFFCYGCYFVHGMVQCGHLGRACTLTPRSNGGTRAQGPVVPPDPEYQTWLNDKAAREQHQQELVRQSQIAAAVRAELQGVLGNFAQAPQATQSARTPVSPTDTGLFQNSPIPLTYGQPTQPLPEPTIDLANSSPVPNEGGTLLPGLAANYRTSDHRFSRYDTGFRNAGERLDQLDEGLRETSTQVAHMQQALADAETQLTRLANSFSTFNTTLPRAIQTAMAGHTTALGGVTKLELVDVVNEKLDSALLRSEARISQANSEHILHALNQSNDRLVEHIGSETSSMDSKFTDQIGVISASLHTLTDAVFAQGNKRKAPSKSAKSNASAKGKGKGKATEVACTAESPGTAAQGALPEPMARGPPLTVPLPPDVGGGLAAVVLTTADGSVPTAATIPLPAVAFPNLAPVVAHNPLLDEEAPLIAPVANRVILSGSGTLRLGLLPQVPAQDAPTDALLARPPAPLGVQTEEGQGPALVLPPAVLDPAQLMAPPAPNGPPDQAEGDGTANEAPEATMEGVATRSSLMALGNSVSRALSNRLASATIAKVVRSRAERLAAEQTEEAAGSVGSDGPSTSNQSGKGRGRGRKR